MDAIRAISNFSAMTFALGGDLGSAVLLQTALWVGLIIALAVTAQMVTRSPYSLVPIILLAMYPGLLIYRNIIIAEDSLYSFSEFGGDRIAARPHGQGPNPLLGGRHRYPACGGGSLHQITGVSCLHRRYPARNLDCLALHASSAGTSRPVLCECLGIASDGLSHRRFVY